MSVSFNLPGGSGSRFGPGLRIQIQSSIAGPLPAGSLLNMPISIDNPATQLLCTMVVPTTAVFVDIPVWGGDPDNPLFAGFYALSAGGAAFLTATFLEAPSFSVFDTGTIAITWDPVSGLSTVVQRGVSAGGSGGSIASLVQQLYANQP